MECREYPLGHDLGSALARDLKLGEPIMNSTHAAWLNTACAMLAVIIPTLASTPLPSWVTPCVLAVNAALHALLPDAPSGGKTP